MAEISAVIPTWNRRRVLKLSLLSARRQRDVDIEVIVVDDASTDDTVTMVSGLQDGRVRPVTHDVARGVSATRNRGIAEANGEWIAFLDDDAVWAPDKLALQREAAADAARTWVYAGDVNVDDDLTVLTAFRPPTPEQVIAELPRFNPGQTGASNVMVRGDALAEVGLFDPALRRTEDWDLWIRLAMTGPPAYVGRPLVGYRCPRSHGGAR